jgi:hypothetical protein
MLGRGLIDRALFTVQGPPGSPPLPLHDDDIGKLLVAKNLRWRQEAYFASSLKRSEWDPYHPNYRDFRDRLMWSENCPPDLADNEELLGECLPDGPGGFDDETLCWFPWNEYFQLFNIRALAV